MTGCQKYLVNVTVFFFLIMAAIFLAELIPHPRAMYILVLSVCAIPAAIFANIRLPMDDVSVAGTVVGMMVLGVYGTSMMWFLEKMNVPRDYIVVVYLAPILLYAYIRKTMKKKA